MYIITTTHGRKPRVNEKYEGRGAEVVVPLTTRHAVATLDKARTEAHWQVLRRQGTIGQGDQAMELPESGGTVGPLPDGTVIEVVAYDWEAFREMSGAVGRWRTGHQATIDAYNAAQGATA